MSLGSVTVEKSRSEQDVDARQTGGSYAGPEAEAARRPQRSGWLARIAVAVVIGLVGGAVWGMSRSSEPSPDASLAEAQAFVGDATSYRFMITMKSRITTGDPAGAGAETSSRSITTGAVAGPDRWTMTSEYADVMFDGPYSDTVIRSGDDVYVKTSPLGPVTDVAAPPWSKLAPDESNPTIEDLTEALSWMVEESDLGVNPFSDGFAVETLLSAYLLDVQNTPTSVVRLVEEAATPVIEERLADGGVRLRVTLPPVAAIAEVVESAYDQEIAPVDVLLDVDAEGRPTNARFSAELGGASAELVVDFDGWGSDIEVAAPADDQVDQTPWVQEEALRALDASLLLAPTSIPEPLGLTGVMAYEGTGEEWDCTSLELSYADPAVMEVEDPNDAELWTLPYLYLSVHPAQCWLADDTAPFDRTLGGHPARRTQGFWEIQIGDAVIEIDTTLDDDSLDAFAASIAPTTADALIAASPEPPEATFGW